MPPNTDLAVAFVKENVATSPEVERAQARKALYGADLATSLIEVAVVDETRLTEVASTALQLPSVCIGELPRASDQALSSLPKDVATRFGVFPLQVAGDELLLAVSEPLTERARDEIARLAQRPISQRYAPGPRVREALCRDYDLAIDRRSQRALAKLTGQPDPSPSLAPPPIADTPRLSSLPRAPSMPPIGLPDAEAGPVRIPPPSGLPRPAMEDETPRPQLEATTTLASPTGKKPTQPGVAPASQPPPAPSPVAVSPIATPVPRRLGLPGLAPRIATKAGFPKSVPTSPEAPAHNASNVSQPPRQSLAPGVSLAPTPSLPPAGSSVRWAGTQPVAATLKRKQKRHRGPYTAALVEEDLRSATATSEVLGAFFDFAAQFFEYSALFAVHGDIAEGRESNGPGLNRGAIKAIGIPLDIPSSMSKARDQNQYVLDRLAKDGIDANLQSDLQRPFNARVFILPVSVRGRSVLLFYGDEGKNDVTLTEVGDVLALAPLVASSLERILLQRKGARQGGPVAGGFVAPARPRFTTPNAQQRANALASALDLAALGPNMDTMKTPLPPSGTESLAPRRLTPLVNPGMVSRPPEPATGFVGKHPTPVIPGTKPTPNQTQPLLLLGETRRPSDAVEDDWEIPDDPMPANVKNSSLRPPKQSSAPRSIDTMSTTPPGADAKLPTIAENPGSVLRQQQIAAELLVAELLSGEPSAEANLIALGVSAVAHVINHFPGPLDVPVSLRNDSSKIRAASQCGPILRVLARMGEQATPFVVARTGDADPQVRIWATLLLAEMPHQSSAEAICRRLLDENEEVRRAALRSAGELGRIPGMRRAVAEVLSNFLSGGTLSEEDRFGVVQALVELKLDHALPRLLKMLHGSPAVAQPAEWALRALTCQDFGTDPAPWDAWWQTNSAKTRVEWLVDALAHSKLELRRNAFAELRELAHRDFGYRETLTLDQVREVQQRYLEWWRVSGQAEA